MSLLAKTGGRCGSSVATVLQTFAAASLCLVSVGCGTLERAIERDSQGSDRILLGPRDTIELLRYGEDAKAYVCRIGVLVCQGGGVTQQCTCGRPEIR